MKFDSFTHQPAMLITAENEDEKAMLNVAIAALELIYPKPEDLSRPTPALLLLETLKIVGGRMERERNPASGCPAANEDAPPNKSPAESASQHGSPQ